MLKNILALLTLSFSLSACQTIHLVNGGETPTTYSQEAWHHIGVIDLVEFSDPVALDKTCEGKPWKAVRTRQSVGQVFLGLVPYLNLGWGPLEVSVACQ